MYEDDFIDQLAIVTKTIYFNYTDLLIREGDLDIDLRYLYLNIEDKLVFKVNKTSTILKISDSLPNVGLDYFY
jgi:hypothetical protein